MFKDISSVNKFLFHQTDSLSSSLKVEMVLCKLDYCCYCYILLPRNAGNNRKLKTALSYMPIVNQMHNHSNN